MTGMMASIWNNAASLGAPAAVLRSVNDYAFRRTPEGKYATLLYGELHSSGLFTWVNAGHPLPLVIRHRGKVERFLPVAGVPPVGLLESAEWPPREPRESWTRLEKNDLVLLATDGVTNASGPSGEFDDDRLCLLAAEIGPALTCEEATERILAELRRHTGTDSFSDDVTIVAVRYLGAD